MIAAESPANHLLTALVRSASSAVGIPGSDRFVHIVEDWDRLVGPSSGVVRVPERLSEYDGETLDLDRCSADGTRSDLIRFYRRLVGQGSVQEQEELLNPELVLLYWGAPLAQVAVRVLWEARFPWLSPTPIETSVEAVRPGSNRR